MTIELGVRGFSINLMGGAPATLQALWWAARWLAERRADRLLLLAVEAFHDVRDLFGRARRLYAGPLVEGAACLLLERGEGGYPPVGIRASRAGTGASGPSRRCSRQVLNGDRPGLVWSGATGAGREAAEASVLAGQGAPAAMPRLGEALAIGPLLALAGAHRRHAPCALAPERHVA